MIINDSKKLNQLKLHKQLILWRLTMKNYQLIHNFVKQQKDATLCDFSL